MGPNVGAFADYSFLLPIGIFFIGGKIRGTKDDTIKIQTILASYTRITMERHFTKSGNIVMLSSFVLFLSSFYIRNDRKTDRHCVYWNRTGKFYSRHWTMAIAGERLGTQNDSLCDWRILLYDRTGSSSFRLNLNINLRT